MKVYKQSQTIQRNITCHTHIKTEKNRQLFSSGKTSPLSLHVQNVPLPMLNVNDGHRSTVILSMALGVHQPTNELNYRQAETDRPL